jgi:hypothetical protein
MRRTLNQRLKRLEARFVPAVKPKDFNICFVNPDGTTAGHLYLRGGRKIWDPPRDFAPTGEPAGKDAL